MSVRRYARTSRDPTSAAESAEAYARQVNTDAAWLVAADAWEETGDLTRARRMLLHQPSFGEETRRRLDAWEDASAEWQARTQHRGGFLPEHIREIGRLAGTPRPTNDQIAILQLADFLRNPPERLFGYYNGDRITDFVGNEVGTITRRGGATRAYGRGPRLQHVTVHAINGFMYSGTCNLETGTYCKLRRGKAWLRR